MLQLQRKSLIQISLLEMAGVESAKKALWALLRNLDAGRTAKLTVTTARGKLKVILEESFDQHSNVLPSTKAPRRVSPSQLRRKERRAADPAVRQRAAEHTSATGEAPTSSELDDAALPSPEKVRSRCPANSLKTTPVKEVIREEVSEDVVEKPSFLEVPHDFADRATNDYNAENDIEKIKEAEKILRETDRCCFCDYKCPPPSRQENDDREGSFGILQSLWDHIEDSHQLAYEWLS